jgi:Tfp pilus assembly protein PilF
VKAARRSLEKAIAIDPMALDGGAYTSLGALYYQVPGWPVAFGDDRKARELLEQALKINPNGIDSNYFYGDFLAREKEYAAARAALEKALRAPDRPARALADAGRRDEITTLLASIP